jgi:hypothetical protein
MQGIYTYIPETNHVLKKHNVAAILSLLFMVPISLAPTLDLMSFTSALSEVCVQCPIWQFSVLLLLSSSSLSLLLSVALQPSAGYRLLVYEVS